jgi:predicted secreted protein
MASASVTGRTAALYASTSLVAATSAMTRVAELNDVTLTLNRKTIDVTNHDSSGFTENLHGIADWKVTGKVNYISTGAGQKIYAQQIFANSPLPVRVSVAATTSKTAHLWVGNAKIAKFEINHPTDKQSIANIELIGNGVITRTS